MVDAALVFMDVLPDGAQNGGIRLIQVLPPATACSQSLAE